MAIEIVKADKLKSAKIKLVQMGKDLIEDCSVIQTNVKNTDVGNHKTIKYTQFVEAATDSIKNTKVGRDVNVDQLMLAIKQGDADPRGHNVNEDKKQCYFVGGAEKALKEKGSYAVISLCSTIAGAPPKKKKMDIKKKVCAMSEKTLKKNLTSIDQNSDGTVSELTARYLTALERDENEKLDAKCVKKLCFDAHELHEHVKKSQKIGDGRVSNTAYTQLQQNGGNPENYGIREYFDIEDVDNIIFQYEIMNEMASMQKARIDQKDQKLLLDVVIPAFTSYIQENPSVAMVGRWAEKIPGSSIVKGVFKKAKDAVLWIFQNPFYANLALITTKMLTTMGCIWVMGIPPKEFEAFKKQVLATLDPNNAFPILTLCIKIGYEMTKCAIALMRFEVKNLYQCAKEGIGLIVRGIPEAQLKMIIGMLDRTFKQIFTIFGASSWISNTWDTWIAIVNANGTDKEYSLSACILKFIDMEDLQAAKDNIKNEDIIADQKIRTNVSDSLLGVGPFERDETTDKLRITAPSSSIGAMATYQISMALVLFITRNITIDSFIHMVETGTGVLGAILSPFTAGTASFVATGAVMTLEVWRNAINVLRSNFPMLNDPSASLRDMIVKAMQWGKAGWVIRQWFIQASESISWLFSCLCKQLKESYGNGNDGGTPDKSCCMDSLYQSIMGIYKTRDENKSIQDGKILTLSANEGTITNVAKDLVSGATRGVGKILSAPGSVLSWMSGTHANNAVLMMMHPRSKKIMRLPKNIQKRFDHDTSKMNPTRKKRYNVNTRKQLREWLKKRKASGLYRSIVSEMRICENTKGV